MAERPKAAVLKTATPFGGHGFESHPLRLPLPWKGAWPLLRSRSVIRGNRLNSGDHP